jgi:hypothetical protein
MMSELAVKSRSIAVALFFFLAVGAAAPTSWAQDPSAYKAQADNHAKVASELAEEAQRTLQGPVTRENLQLAAGLYTRAGQLFEQASNIYKALGPDYATREDVESSARAVEMCIQAIQEIKKRLA